MKYERFLFLFGLILWLIFDIISTTFGFYIGMHEGNPFIKNQSLLFIIFLKLIGTYIIYIIYMNKDVIQSRYRYITFYFVWFMAILIIFINSYNIINHLKIINEIGV